MSYPRRLGTALLLVAVTYAVGQTPPVPNKEADNKKTVELVERLLAARKEYQMTLETLRAHYIKAGDLEHARWAEEELVHYHRIAKQAYILALDAPPPTLQANYNIPQANELYRRAMGYKDKGWGTDYIDNQRRAELLLQKMLTNYPQCSRISDAAYQLGDIYESKAYKQYARAAVYFERCFQWNDKTHFDARMRAARLYDKTLNDREKAKAIYMEATRHETDEARQAEAKKRIQELGAKR
jgi:hypothetical protein